MKRRVVKYGCHNSGTYLYLSSITPKSLTKSTGLRDLPMNETDRSVGSLLTCCLVPITMNLVFSGLIKRWFSQHQLATLNRSCSRFVIAVSISRIGKERKTFESSTYDSRLESRGIEGTPPVRARRLG